MSLFDRLFNSTKADEQVKSLINQLSEDVTQRVASRLQDEFIALQEVEDATRKVTDLQKEIAKLNAEKESIQDGFSRKEREIEHKTGLLRLEIEAEQKQSAKDFELRVQEAKLAAREVGLTEREKAFGEKMNFIEKRFTEEVGYLKTMVKDMSERLPSAAILATKEL